MDSDRMTLTVSKTPHMPVKRSASRKDDEGYGSWDRGKRPGFPNVACPSPATHLIPELIWEITSWLSSGTEESQQALLSLSLLNTHWAEYVRPRLWQAPLFGSEESFKAFTRGLMGLPNPTLDVEMDGCHPEFTIANQHPWLAIAADEDECLSQEALQKLAWIKVLDLSRVRLYEPAHKAAFALLSTHCPNLITVKLWIEDPALQTLSQFLVKSTTLANVSLVGHIRSWSLHHSPSTLNKAIGRLQSIHIDVGYEGDVGRFRMAKLIGQAVGPGLRHLSLLGSGPEELVRSVVERAPNIQSLVYSWSGLSERSLCLLGHHATQLRILNLRGCHFAVQPLPMRELLQGCPNLSQLDVSFTQGGTDTLRVLRDHGKSLKVLILSGYTCDESAMLYFLSERGRQLTVLSLAWCGALLTTPVLRSIGSHCPRLEKLDLRGLAHEPESTLRRVIKRCPLLRVLKVEGLPSSSSPSHGAEFPQEDGERQRSRRNSNGSLMSIHEVEEALHARTSYQSFLISLRFKFPLDDSVSLDETV